jgi:pyocin large subunit-like protein
MPTFPSQQKRSNSGYGQNGYQGPSSDEPGQHTTSGFLPQATVPANEHQLRTVSAESYPIHPGMKSPAAPGKIPAINTHRASGPITNSSFQR